LISEATLQDIPQLEILINSAYRGEESKKGWTTEADLLKGKRVEADALANIISQPEAVILKYCDNDNNLVGCVYLKQDNSSMYLGMLTVSPTLQAGGIGKKILQAAEKYAIDKKCDTIEMKVISIRYELITWYERHGFYNTGKVSPFPDDPLSIQTQPLEFITMEKNCNNYQNKKK
jgi:ribosomal protein S18 acetylase RimI-like enzyme